MNLKILGSGQDAGVPHTGCYCEICEIARKDINFRRLGPSIAIFDKKKEFCYLIDISPDFKNQLDMIKSENIKIKRKGKTPISGIFLTHAHFGHCSGLWYLGKESLNEMNLPVYCTQKMINFLENNYPFSFLIQNNNIEVLEIIPKKEYNFDGFLLTPKLIPHRNEIADTVGYIIKSKKRVLYLPDLDYWTEKLIEEVLKSDIAIIDGSFYSKDELPRFSDVPHPPILESIKHFKNTNTEIYFTHLNHTNVINKNGKERDFIETLGFKFAFDGMNIEI